LESILTNDTENIELVILDDCSTDNTYSIISDYLNDATVNVKLCQNKVNKGMDFNFFSITQYASGTFVWYFGQDDIMEKDAISKIINIISRNNNIGIMSLNYSQYSNEFNDKIRMSLLSYNALSNIDIKSSEILIYNSLTQYYTDFYTLPSFLPATIIKKDYFSRVDEEQKKEFYGTAYIQIAVMHIGYREEKIVVVPQEYIKGLIPDSGWQEDGTKMFNIALGNLYLKSVLVEKYNLLPKHIFHIQRRRFNANLLFFISECKNRGLVSKNVKYLYYREIANSKIMYYSIYLPLIFTPKKILATISKSLLLFKRVLISKKFVQRYFKIN
jgi:glycosyltransferase involved in cell wall biosynthesis